MPYLLHVAILLALSCCLYRWLIERTTFFRLNRSILLLCLGLCFGLPLLNVPTSWAIIEGLTSWQSFQGTGNKVIDSPQSSDSFLPTYSLSISQHTKGVQVPTEANYLLRFRNILYLIYWGGVMVVGCRFLWQFFHLIYLILHHPSKYVEKIQIIQLSQNRAPFSFGNTIFVNPSLYDASTYRQIFAHEAIHIRQWHSIDLILTELLIVFQWFNPFAYLYKKCVENNLEFLTDQQMLRQGLDAPSYQISLLKVALPQKSVPLGSPYTQSFLKKRISMMNRPSSSKLAPYRHLILLGGLCGTLCLLNAKIDDQSIRGTQRVISAGDESIYRYDETAKSPLAGLDSLLLTQFRLIREHLQDPESLLALEESGIENELLAALHQHGLVDITMNELILAGEYALQASYVQQIHQMGYSTLGLKDILQFHLHQINLDELETYSKKLAANASAPEILRAIQAGKGWGRIVTDNRQLSGFSQIDVAGNIRLVMQKGIEDQVLVKGFEQKVNLIETTVAQGTLRVRTLPGYQSGHVYDVWVVAKNLHRGQVIRGEADYVSPAFLCLE
ncbi:MAG: M56 family metallopeptidase [Bacteroidota bacterium]